MTEELDGLRDRASDATAGLIREQAEEIGFQRAEVERHRDNATAWKAKADTATAEINDLRAQLMEALLGNERLRGYIDGKREAEAPRMVPERPRYPEWTEHGPPVEPRAPYSGAPRPKPWFAR